MKRHLLISSSVTYGTGYLDHAMAAIRDFLGPTRRLLFVPFALKDQEAYTAKVRARFASEGIDLTGLTADPAALAALEAAEAVFVGGGNTFRLLDRLQRSGLLAPLRRRVEAGLPYVGSSAGTNIAAPTIRTTNDMPIVEPASFEALGLVPFQINPHYLDPEPASRHMGETREERILQYLEENDRVVVGLREGSRLRREDARLTLEGTADARIFRSGRAPQEVPPGTSLDELLG